jgi:hypothetical protein
MSAWETIKAAFASRDIQSQHTFSRSLLYLELHCKFPDTEDLRKLILRAIRSQGKDPTTIMLLRRFSEGLADLVCSFCRAHPKVTKNDLKWCLHVPCLEEVRHRYMENIRPHIVALRLCLEQGDFEAYHDL